ncbi:MAG: NAD-dependent epimerase/dehydratase family protein [Chthoniobacterales bacterium]|nr:NAD-dependent epimerase/dehydratase family protein [Chthoniobacterales bacterium]
MPGTVFVTGGSGFVGSAVISAIIERGYSVNALVRGRSATTGGGNVREIKGDLFDRKALDDGMSGCVAVVHLVGIIMEKRSKGVTFERIHTQGTRSVVDAALRNGVKRYVHMSALGTRSDAVSTYHRTKYQAEEYVRASGLANGLDWTIIRPSLIHGPRGEFMKMEAAWARGKSPPFLFMPYFGAGPLGRGGAGMLQPVFVEDVARAFVDAIEKPQTIGEIYPLGGPDRLTWPELHHTVARHVVGKKRLVMAVPAWYAKLITQVAPAALLPFNRDQVIMSQEDNTCDVTKAARAFGWEPQPFEPTLAKYATQL